MKAKYQPALDRVLVHEGGIIDHPADPGGLTNQGVTQRVYDLYRKARKQPQQTVRKMSTAERNAIYKSRYWDVVKGDDLPAGIDYVVFDGAVNSGPVQSVKWLQRALGARYTGTVDGMMGQSTLAAVIEHPNHDALVAAICQRRLAFLKALKTWRTFGRGWAARVSQVEDIGQAWASGSAGPAASFIMDASAKANIEDAKTAPSKAMGDAATGGGVGAGGIAGTVQSLQDQLTPFSAAGDWITKVVVVLAVSAAALTAGGLAYRWYVKRKEAKLADALGTAI